MRSLVLGLALLPAAAAAETPRITKVEPPSWWAGHTLRPVRLLLRGQELAGAKVTIDGGGVTAGAPRISASGTSLFVDVSIEPAAKPGSRTLRVRTARGSALAPFEVLAPQPRGGGPQGFSSDDVIYLIMPDRFANGDPSNDDPERSRGLHDRTKARFYHGGDLQGVIDKLPYLKDLGVTAIWTTPFYDNADRIDPRQTYDGHAFTDYHGYGAVDFYAVDEHLGDVAKVRELVERAHALGLKVLQDEVVNHTGPDHAWVEDPPTPTWFNGTAQQHLNNTWQIWTLTDPYATPETRAATVDGWFADILPDLDQDDPEVARYFIQNSLWWVGIAGFDGIRQDTLPYVPRRFWRDWTTALARQHPGLRILGELYDGDPAMASYYQRGAKGHDGIDTGIHSLFDFGLFHPARRAFAEGKPLREVVAMLAHDRLYPAPENLATFLGLHDMPRFMNEPGATIAGLKLGLTFIFTTRGAPILYSGDEIAMRGGADPDNRRDFPGGFPDDAASAFTAPGRTAEQDEVFQHVRTLGRLRAALTPLRRGRLTNLHVAEQSYVYARSHEGETVVMAINNDSTPVSLDVVVPPGLLRPGVALADRLGGSGARLHGNRLRLELGARSAAMLTSAAVAR